MTNRLNHARLADLLDRAHAAAVDLDSALAAAGFRSWPQGEPRWHALVALEQLGHVRHGLDRIAVAAGGAAAHAFIRRDLAPTATTRAAAQAAVAETWPYRTEEHASIGQAHRRPKATTVDADAETAP